MHPVVLSPHQITAVTHALDSLERGAEIVAIRGLAGTGKTTLIPTLREMLAAQELDSAVGTPTHKAAVVLRNKGVKDAGTIHSLALTPYFLADYARLMEWLGEPVPCDEAERVNQTPDVDGLPALAAQSLKRLDISKRVLLNRASRYGAHKAASSIGVHGQSYFHKFGPKLGRGVLIIDEASMVGKASLELCQQAYSKIIVIGDPGQLPPVKDLEVLSTIPGFDLVEIHRQAADSPIITLAYAARRGTHDWRMIPVSAGKIDSLRRLDPGACLQSPILVWTNDLRMQLTCQVRQGLGYKDAQIEIGEPLMCKATDKASRAAGFVNNSHWRVVERSKDSPRRVTIQEEGAEKTYDVLLHMEELDGTDVDPESVPFRFAYAITVHTAQGSEWPTVYISHPSLLRHAGASRAKKGDPEEFKRWSYTAVTRAKETLGFLTQHDFSPLMAVSPPRVEPMETVPLLMSDTHTDPQTMALPDPQHDLQEPADIPDPAVPPGTTDVLPPTVSALPDSLVPLAHGFCQYIQAKLVGQLTDAGIRLARDVDKTITAMADYTKGVLATNEHAHYSFADALAKITATQAPYTVSIMALSPSGFPVTLTLTKPTAGELVEELAKLMPWLEANGYTGQSHGLV